MSLKMRLRLEQSLSQEMLQQLRLELKQNVGDFERQILEKVKFVDIDTDAEENKYHLDMLRALVLRESEEEKSLLAQITSETGRGIPDIQEIKVESFEATDISHDIGTKRNVDVMTLVFNDDQMLTMTVSLDKEEYTTPEESPSLQEAVTLQHIDSAHVPAVQKFYGSTKLRDETGIRGLISKEFLEGEMLANFTTDIDPYMSDDEKTRVAAIAESTGAMIASCLNELSGVPRDSNGLNIIIGENQQGFTARYCDVEGIVRDTDSVQKEIKLLKESFGEFGTHFTDALQKGYAGDLLK